MKKGTGSLSLFTWEDLYYDGLISDEDGFCEYTQTIIRKKKVNDGWDDPEDYIEDVEWED